MNTLSRLDRFASSTVRVLYLVGLLLSIAAFFSGVTFDYWWITLPIAFACAAALVMHEFLVQRRVRSLRGRLDRCRDEATRANLRRQYWTQLGVLTLLVLFDMFNITEYTSNTVLHHALVSGDILAIVRGICLAGFFFLSSLLVEVEDDAGVILARSANDMLFQTVKATSQQWTSRVDHAKRDGVNLAAISATLMEDAGETDAARRVRMIEEGLRQTETGKGGTNPKGFRYSRESKIYLPESLNSSGAKPVNSDTQNEPGNQTSKGGKIFLLKKGRGKGTKKTKKQRAFDYLDTHPEASLTEVEKAADVGRGTAVSYRQEWRENNSIKLEAEG